MNSKKKTEKYNNLIDAAVEIFAEKGYHQAKIKDITDKAKVGAGTFYLYFKNKEEIINNLLDKYLTMIQDKIKIILLSEDDPLTKLEKIIYEKVKFFDQNRKFVSVYFEHIPGAENFSITRNFHTHGVDFLKSVELVIIQGQSKGLISKDINPIILSRSLRGAIILAATNIFVMEEKESITPEQVSESIYQIFTKGITQ